MNTMNEKINILTNKSVHSPILMLFIISQTDSKKAEVKLL